MAKPTKPFRPASRGEAQRQEETAHYERVATWRANDARRKRMMREFLAQKPAPGGEDPHDEGAPE